VSDEINFNEEHLDRLEGKYVIFKLGKEDFGLEILKVREIIGMLDITFVPKSAHYVKGVINLRGKVIPVIDLRLKLGLDEQEYTDRTCIIVLETADTSDYSFNGIVVDAVSEVLNIRGDQIQPAKQIGSEFDTDYILGMADTDIGLKILLDADKALNGAANFVMS